MTDESTIDPEYLEDLEPLKVEVEQFVGPELFDSTLLYRIQTYIGGKRKDLQGNEIHGQYDLVSVLNRTGPRVCSLLVERHRR